MEEVNDELEPEDYDYTVVATLHDSVSFTRGLGNTGRKVYIVEKECEHPGCSYDRQVQTIRVHPEGRNTVAYECQNPNCPNFHDGRLGIRTMR
jgi:hypothetical protein